MTETNISIFNILNKIRELRLRPHGTFSSSMVSAAAAEAVGASIGDVRSVSFFEDVTGKYAEVLVDGTNDCFCGMKLCCMVDMQTLEVRGIIAVDGNSETTDFKI